MIIKKTYERDMVRESIYDNQDTFARSCCHLQGFKKSRDFGLFDFILLANETRLSTLYYVVSHVWSKVPLQGVKFVATRVFGP